MASGPVFSAPSLDSICPITSSMTSLRLDKPSMAFSSADSALMAGWRMAAGGLEMAADGLGMTAGSWWVVFGLVWVEGL